MLAGTGTELISRGLTNLWPWDERLHELALTLCVVGVSLMHQKPAASPSQQSTVKTESNMTTFRGVGESDQTEETH